MTPSETALRQDADLDQQLADVLAEVAARLQAGQSVDLSEYVRRCPEHADRIGQLLPAMKTLAELGRSRSSVRSSVAGAAEPVGTVERELGDFRILREIGRGGMGVVYEAQQISLGRRVALKVLPFAAVLDPRHLQRFKNEAQAAAALEHPNIVNVHAVGCERGVHYYAMQYIDGQTLGQVIDDLRRGSDVAQPPSAVREGHDDTAQPGAAVPRQTPLAPSSSPLAPDTSPKAAISTQRSHRTPEFFRSVANLGIQAAEALEHAHQMGVVHRDIKPSNLMVDARGHLWITDFGLALTHTGANLTMTGDILGTLRYMSPEQAAGKSRVLDHHTDIYSLGLTLYELLTLRPAFEGDDRQRLLCKIVADDPPLPRQHNPSIPRDLETIVLKATAKEPSHRYASAQQMADDLRRYLDDKPIRARRPSLRDRAAKWSRRHKPVVWSTAVLLLAAVTAIVVVAWNRYQKVLQIEQHLTVAGAFLQAGDYVAADRELAEARGRLGAVLYPSGGLAADLAGLTGQVSGKKEAEERFQRFQDYRQSVHANMYNATPNTMDRVQENCRAALALYRVFDSDRLEGQQGFELLSPQRQAVLKEAVAELLFAWAEMEAAREQEPRDLPEAHRRTIAALERIERFYRPIPAVYLWIAQSRRALGEADAARQAEKRAAAHPPATGLDYFVLGEFHYMCEEQPEKALADYSLALRRQPDHYLSLLASGLTLWARERHEEAVAMLTGAIAVNPRTTIAYIWRAWSCRSLKQFDLAQADFDAAVAIDPQDYHAYWGLGQLRGDRGDDAAALAMFDKAVALAPTTPSPLLVERGLLHVKMGNREKALADFSRVIEWLRPRLELAQSIRHYRGAMHADPLERYICACKERSQIYKQLGQLDKAEDDLKEALRPTPKSGQSYQARATVEAGQGEFDKAIADYTEAIRRDPLSSRAYNSRGIAYKNKRDYDRAIADYSEAIRLDPQNWAAYSNRGVASEETGDRDRAIADLNEAIRLNPQSSGAYSNRGIAYSNKGDHDRAIADFNEAMRLDPKYGGHYVSRGRAYLNKHEIERAIADLEKAIELQPDDPQTCNGVAWFWVTCPERRIWNPARAVELAKKATQREPGNWRYWNTLGVAQYRAGDYEAAIKALGKSMELQSGGDSFDWFFLAMAHWQLKHADEARRWYDKAAAWMEKNKSLDDELLRFRAEAAELLGIPPKPPAGKEKPEEKPKAESGKRKADG